MAISARSTILYNNWIRGQSSGSSDDDKNNNKKDENKKDKPVWEQNLKII